MTLGAPSKWTFARRVAALFVHVALASSDVARLYLFRSSGAALAQFPLRGAKAATQGFLSFLEAARADAVPALPSRLAGGSPVLGAAVSEFLRGSPTRGRVILIGDFWQEEQELIAAVSRLAGAGMDAAAIHVLAPEELSPRAEGQLLARALEEDGEVELSAGSEFPAAYARELEAHCHAVEQAFRRRGGNYLRAESDTSIERVLIAALRQRRWVM
jgi:uncharacterized protein (DUF58 family)